MVFGLSKDRQATDVKPASKKKQTKSSNDDAADEAQQLLEEMQAKDDGETCVFC